MAVANHPNVGVCWNSNRSDIVGGSIKANFDLVKNKLGRTCHINELYSGYPYRELFSAAPLGRFRGLLPGRVPGDERSSAGHAVLPRAVARIVTHRRKDRVSERITATAESAGSRSPAVRHGASPWPFGEAIRPGERCAGGREIPFGAAVR